MSPRAVSRGLASLLVVGWCSSVGSLGATAAENVVAPAPSPAPAPAPAPASDDEDVRARNLFQAHEYTAALALYLKLHEQTHHPTYLRNIGRCHQMMRQPDDAIRWFEAYLGSSPALAPAERAEIEGYIAEMRALKASPPAPSPKPSLSPVLLPAAPAPPPNAAVVNANDHRPAAASSARQIWVLAGIGAVVVGVVAVALLTSSGSSRLPCPADTVCGP